jgi:predicted kinase
MQQTLFLMYGYPGSGKSAFSKQLSGARDVSRLSSDELREHMWSDMETGRKPENASAIFGAIGYMTERLLEVSRSVLYDINCNKHDRRMTVVGKYNVRTIVVWVQTPIENARTREMDRLSDPGYTAIPQERYDELVNDMEDPGADEIVIRIDGSVPFETQLKMFDEQLRELA